MCSLAIWHTSRPSGNSHDQNWRTNEPKLTQMCSLAIWHTSRPQEPQMTEIGAQMSQNSPKCAVWPFGTHRDPQEPQMTKIGALMSQNSPKCAVWPFGTHRDPQEPQMTEIGALDELKLTQMCSLAIWHTSRPSGTS